MSANKPKEQKEQDVNRKPGRDEEEPNQGQTPRQQGDKGNDQGGQDKDKDKNKGGDFQTR